MSILLSLINYLFVSLVEWLVFVACINRNRLLVDKGSLLCFRKLTLNSIISQTFKLFGRFLRSMFVETRNHCIDLMFRAWRESLGFGKSAAPTLISVNELSLGVLWVMIILEVMMLVQNSHCIQICRIQMLIFIRVHLTILLLLQLHHRILIHLIVLVVVIGGKLMISESSHSSFRPKLLPIPRYLSSSGPNLITSPSSLGFLTRSTIGSLMLVSVWISGWMINPNPTRWY